LAIRVKSRILIFCSNQDKNKTGKFNFAKSTHTWQYILCSHGEILLNFVISYSFGQKEYSAQNLISSALKKNN
jgi:hypothetical protein